jgi:hypothetical protein
MITLIIFIVAYFALLAVLSLAVRPYRLRLKVACEHLFDEAPLAQGDIKMLQSMLSSAYSIRAAPLLILVFMMGILRSGQQLDSDVEKFDKENPMFVANRRVWHEVLEMHMVSAFAANPFFGIAAYIARWIFRAKARAYFARTHQPTKSVDFYELKAVSP